MNYILAIFGLIAFDQASKFLVVRYLKPTGTFPIVGDFLQLTYTQNTGAAFSILENQRWFFVFITSVLIIICLYLLIAGKFKDDIGNFSLCLIIAGGAGNMIDRITRGYVVDFIYFKSVNFAIFNFADTCVVVGALLMCFYMINHEYMKKEKHC